MIKNTFKNIVFKKKIEKQLLAIIECQAIIYVCVLFLILLCIIVFEHLHVNTPLIYHVLVSFHFVLIRWMFLCFICIFDWFCSQVENLELDMACMLYIFFSLSFSLPHSQLVIHHI